MIRPVVMDQQKDDTMKPDGRQDKKSIHTAEKILKNGYMDASARETVRLW